MTIIACVLDIGGLCRTGTCAVGLLRMLVQTGKYRTGDEAGLPPRAHLARDVGEAVDTILG